MSRRPYPDPTIDSGYERLSEVLAYQAQAEAVEYVTPAGPSGDEIVENASGSGDSSPDVGGQSTLEDRGIALLPRGRTSGAQDPTSHVCPQSGHWNENFRPPLSITSRPTDSHASLSHFGHGASTTLVGCRRDPKRRLANCLGKFTAGGGFVAFIGGDETPAPAISRSRSASAGVAPPPRRRGRNARRRPRGGSRGRPRVPRVDSARIGAGLVARGDWPLRPPGRRPPPRASGCGSPRRSPDRRGGWRRVARTR